ncbi:MAG: hypothetical protein IPJ87_09610 [Flavobacteriales bacterium]|nr:hypothetical protein [Flavobacteriales bacterium]MBK7942113.1 hypothetical protein [Flavobacteriales bacterium]MBK9700655.1 hypothetical protein [Flavobacteriales bacterium]
MRKLLAFSSVVIVACIIVLMVRGELVAVELGHHSPNCHGKYYPLFWYCCLGVIAIALLLCLVFLFTLITKRIAYSTWEIAVFLFGAAVLMFLVFYPAGPRMFLEWLLGDCLNYDLIWW